MFMTPWARRMAARVAPAPKRGFFLEEEPMPKVLPGQGHDDVQLLVADGPVEAPEREYWIGDRVRVVSDPPDEAWTRCTGAVVSKRELHGTDAHEYGVLFDDEHETVLHFWTPQLESAPEDLSDLTPPGEPPAEAFDLDHAHAHRADLLGRPALEDRYLKACQWLREVRGDRGALEAANGRLVARVRTLEAQLRAAGIEPAARE